MKILCIVIITLFDSTALGQGAQDPCHNYQNINEPLRSTGYVAANAGYDHLICDRLLTQGWYRFTSGAGGQIATSCPGLFHCGTHIPIWMNGTHPTVADGIVTRNTCGHQPVSGCCGLKGTIQVKNCGTYYVYELKPTRGCSVAHCAGTKVTCPPDKWSPTGFEPGCKDAYPKMTQSPTLSNPIVKPDTFEFNCHINYDPSATDVGFDVTWLFDGKPDQAVPKGHITGATRDSSIDQKLLVGHLGEELSCRADAFFTQSPGRKGPPIASNGYWMGIKLSEARLEVGEHEKPKEVKLISTIPIVCDKINQQSCHLEVYLEPNNHDFKMTTQCTVTLLPTDWNPTTNQAVTSFHVLAERDFKHDRDRNLMLHFSQIFSNDAPPVFNNYQIPYLQVITKDKPTGLCSCVGDPHCITLDHSPSTSPDLNLGHLWNSQRRYMYDFFKLGEFVMYKSTSRPFEVQIRNWQCGRATCICAVTAREGNDIIRVDICHGTYGHSFPKVMIPNKSQFSQGTVLQKDKTGNKYVISFPSGARVTVVNTGRELNVYINAPEDDYHHTQGLCGTFDGRRDNDQTGKDGHVHHWSRRPDSFVESWRVPVGSSMFDKPPAPDPKLNNDVYFCNCNQAKKQVDCTVDNKAARPALHTRCAGCSIQPLPQKSGQAGRRRQLTAVSNDDDTSVNYFFDYGLFQNLPANATFPTPSGLTEANATMLCTDAMNKSATVSQCVALTGLNFFNEIGSCIEDLRLTDDLSFVQSAVQTAIMSCQEYILKNLSFYNNATGDPPAFITTDLCPSDCSGHGICVQGTCQCDHGFVDDSCAIDSRNPPSLYNIISTTHMSKDTDNCDIHQRPCQKMYVVGENIMYRNTSKCHLKEMKFVNGSFVSTRRFIPTPLVYESMYDVLCHMPTKSQIHDQTVIGFTIFLTNDDVTYSNGLQTFIIDSECLACSDKGGLCTVKPNTCLIDGVCRKANETMPGSRTLVCKPDQSNDQWTNLAVTTASTTTQPVTSIQSTTSTSSSSGTKATSGTPQIATTSIFNTGSSQHNQSGSITQWYFAHLPPGPLGGQVVPRFDIWTLSTSGCLCPFNKSSSECACCDVDGCQCPGSNQYQCVQCGHTNNCGDYLPAPENGVDGYTHSFNNCSCSFNPKLFNCACCQNNGCQCGERHRNQCVHCGHMEQCGIKPWIFGPAFNSTH